MPHYSESINSYFSYLLTSINATKYVITISNTIIGMTRKYESNKSRVKRPRSHLSQNILPIYSELLHSHGKLQNLCPLMNTTLQIIKNEKPNNSKM